MSQQAGLQRTEAGNYIVRTAVLVALIALLGLGVRLFYLGNLGGFDFDEIVSYEYAELPLATMLRTIATRTFEHPPFYYALLHLWFSVPVGRSESFVRLLSVGLGTLTIPTSFLLASRLLRGTRVALLTALLVALSPLEVYFSREARMYALLVLLGVLSLWLLLKALDRGRWWWLLYAIVTVLALYTHYVSLAILLAANFYLAWVWRRNPLPLLGFVTLELAIGLLHFPLINSSSGLTASLPAFGSGSWSWSYLAAIGEETLSGFVVGPEGVVRTRWATVITGVVWIVALAGIVRLVRRRECLLLAALFACTLVALAALVAIDKEFQIRYLLILHVPFLMVVATGLEHVQKWQWWLASAGLAAATALPLLPYYFEYQRGDYQQITQRVELLAVDGDEVVLTGPWQERYWCHFATKDDANVASTAPTDSGCKQATKYELFVHRIPLSVPPALDPVQTDKDMRFIYHVHKPKQLWFVQAGLAQADPTNYVEGWLTEHAWQGYREAFLNGVLSLWAVETRGMTRVVPTNMNISDALAVEWYEIETNPHSGAILRTTFGLRLLKQTGKNIKLSFRLYDGRGEHIQRDVFVGHPHHPTSSWEVGETVLFRAGILLPPGAKPGMYTLGSIFYVGSEPPLPISVGGTVQPDSPHVLGEVELQRSPPEVVDPAVTPREINVQFADPEKSTDRQMVALEGFGIANPTLQPGESLQVLLVWRALRNVDAQLLAELRLIDTVGTVAWEHQRVVGGETYRVDRWIVNDFVRDWYLSELSPTLPKGDYSLQLRVLKPSGREGDEQVALVNATEREISISLGTVHIRSQDDLPARPPLWQRALRRLWREVTK